METISFVSLFFIFKNACFFLDLWLMRPTKTDRPTIFALKNLGDIN